MSTPSRASGARSHATAGNLERHRRWYAEIVQHAGQYAEGALSIVAPISKDHVLDIATGPGTFDLPAEAISTSGTA